MPHFGQYRSFFADLPSRQQYGPSELQVENLLLCEEGDLRIYYAPFDWVNPEAKLIILGITPGWTQMEIACRVARNAVCEGRNDEEVLRWAKHQASFAGVMRTNLVNMLHDLGVHDLLCLKSCADLFDGVASHLLHSSSIYRYPVFIGHGRELRTYSGHHPGIEESHLLADVATRQFVPELRRLGQASIIPLGRSVERALKWLVEQGEISGDRVISDFPHPSGANAGRLKQFEMHRDGLRAQLRHLLG